MAMAMGMARVFGCQVSATGRVVGRSFLEGANTSTDSMYTISRRWASKKAGGSTKNGRDSESKRLGLKKFGGEKVLAGNIIVRQRGTKYHIGRGVGIGKDHTIFATRDGYVRFWYNVPKKRQEVSVKDTPHPVRVAQQSA
ncbi:hypothetical protein Poli38472_002005 [Pythium oligandrum]|uniref:50S ribosomal protein L27 n=1 Tax=Pythium oligandrum TaxID=41045 RepID=A0A8K1CUN2_PYTOL|nr:hypothetical protein Poli38472_002005 [Pythium oligandrum]|eukprot:TMW69849.1 hypothetical protein Poli38472_002005 [Pythium oligandrum]